MTTHTDILWQTPHNTILISPTQGGRILSWRHKASHELVKQTDVTDGGLARVLLGEERYPGASYITPHLVTSQSNGPTDFHITLRYMWNTPNALAHVLGWPDKTNPTCTDGLLLDKTIRFLPKLSAIVVELAITNISGTLRYITPWLQNHFHGWAHDAFVIQNGVKGLYLWHDLFWSGHKTGDSHSMRLVAHNQSNTFFAIQGAATSGLDGMCCYGKSTYGDSSTDACMELRAKTLSLPPNHRFLGNYFLSLTDNSAHWNTDSPVPLYWRTEPAPDTHFDPASLRTLLDHWAHPYEIRDGLMLLSHLDKVPFTSNARFGVTWAFSGFKKHARSARATIHLYVLKDLQNLSVTLHAGKSKPGGWSLSLLPAAVAKGQLIPITLTGPMSLTNKENIRAILRINEKTHAELSIPHDATVEPAYAYQIKQTSTLMQERFTRERSGYTAWLEGKTPSPASFKRWQKQAHKRAYKWVTDNISGKSPLAPRLMERQVGPHCIRDKILLQTEPGLWLPMYVIYAKNRHSRPSKPGPGILFAHGSGPGKLSFAPDETLQMQDPKRIGDWPSPYQFAHQLNAVVAIPDRRGWGEWAEGNHSQRPQRSLAAGFNVTAAEVWDHLCAIDYLRSRPGVDPSCVVSMGSSGGGWMTLFMVGIHPHCAGGIISSCDPQPAALPDQYFSRTFGMESATLHPPAQLPMSTAAITSLAAPKPIWLMEGKWDTGIIPVLPHTPAEAQAAWAAWHNRADRGRAEIAQAYDLLNAPSNCQATWFEGGHLAGFTLDNIALWMKTHFNIDRQP
jgi:predicted esterase